MARIGKSLAVDLRLLPYEIEVNKVYAQALQKIGIIDSDGVDKLHDALDVIMREYIAGEYDTAEFPDEDVHSLIERRLTSLAGPVGARIHTGRSRNDLIMTDVHLCLRDECLRIRGLIGNLGRTILRVADQNADVILPGYTHLQPAQPILLAHYLYSFCFYLADDIGRIENILNGQLSLLPLGAGAIAGSAFPLDREWMAKKLGFSGVTNNSIQTVSSRDEFLELAGAFSILMVHLSRYAEDLIIWSTAEFSFVTLDDSVSTGSSMMPQKRNPDSLELIRGKAARVIGEQQVLFTLLKGLPLAYARDMQEDKPALFDMFEQVGVSLEMFARVIATIQINADKMKGAIGVQMAATDLADYLAKKGMPFREAHGVVANIFRSGPVGGITLENLKAASPLFDSDALALLDPAEGIKLRAVTGGTAPVSVNKQRRILEHFFKG